MLSLSIDRAMQGRHFQLIAFVYMPEHVHLLVYPTSDDSRIDGLLKAIKQPFSYRVKQILNAQGSSLLGRLTIRERPGKTVFRFWQEGAGYDRNLNTPSALEAAVEYIHLNPVRRRLVMRGCDWLWSSCRFYQAPDSQPEEGLPQVHRLPKDCLE